MRHHAVGSHNGAVTDAHAGQHRGVDANSHLVLDDDGATVGRAAVVVVRVVVDGDEVHLGCDEHAVADSDAATVEKGAALLESGTLAYADVLTVVNITLNRFCLTA